MSNWYRFKCICPRCGRGDKDDDWYHSEDSCCSTSGWLYINSECEIKCDDCYDRINQSPSFIIRWKFKCSKHKGYKNPDKFGVLNAISYICSNNNIPDSVRTKMIDIVNHYKY